MVQAIKATLVVAATLMMASQAAAAPCPGQSAPVVEVDVQEAPVTMYGELSLLELQAMSAQIRYAPAHPVLGFYTGTVGYALRGMDVQEVPSGINGKSCPRLTIQADLVVVDRRVAVANDLSVSPCRLKAAVKHYRHHATAASLALHRFAAELPAKLGSEIEQHVQDGLDASQGLRRYVESLLDHAVESFSASLAHVQASVDTPGEVQSLLAPCGGS